MYLGARNLPVLILALALIAVWPGVWTQTLCLPPFLPLWPEVDDAPRPLFPEA